jgi:ribosomal protein S18 acetylase RimI-like enzyme
MIRQAIPDDANEAAPLIMQAIGVIALALTGASNDLEAVKLLKDWFRREGNRHSYQNTLVEELDGRVAGIVVAYPGKGARQLDLPLEQAAAVRRGEPDYRIETEAEPDEFYLDTVSVNPAFQGQGVGRHLIESIYELARRNGYQEVGLLAEIGNLGAQRLYQRLGFEKKTEKLMGQHWYVRLRRRLS